MAEDWCRASPAALRAARGPQMKKLRFKESAAAATGNARRRSHGRPRITPLKKAGPAARGAAPHERRKAAAWGIDGSSSARATVFPRAEQMLRRGAGISKLSVGPRGKLPTLMATRARVPYVSGGVAGGGRPMQAKEAAALLGINLRSEAWQGAESGLSEGELWRATLDSVDAHHVRALWSNCTEMAEAKGRALEGRELRYAGMFAGALDAIFTGGRAAGWPLRYVAAAEQDRLRRRCLGQAYHIPKGRQYMRRRAEWRQSWQRGSTCSARRHRVGCCHRRSGRGGRREARCTPRQSRRYSAGHRPSCWRTWRTCGGWWRSASRW